MSKDRVEGFSDGVFAVALTLLILGVEVPRIINHASFAIYANAMSALIPSFLTFALSFALIANYWVAHHFLFTHIRKVDTAIIWINNLLLLFLCFIPFPTALLGYHLTDQFPILLFAINTLIIALIFFSLRLYIHRKKYFRLDEHSIGTVGPRHSIPAVIFTFLAIIFVFINVYVSLFFLFVMPLIYVVPNFLKID